jgi:hypothetical protein
MAMKAKLRRDQESTRPSAGVRDPESLNESTKLDQTGKVEPFTPGPRAERESLVSIFSNTTVL